MSALKSQPFEKQLNCDHTASSATFTLPQTLPLPLQRLLAAGIPCTYVYVNGLSYIMREVTKVFMGAATILPNGTVISRAGAAAVAMMAAAHSKPVMICCESYKFSERVQLDSITHNELGNPQELVSVAGRKGQVLEVGGVDMGRRQCFRCLLDSLQKPLS